MYIGSISKDFDDICWSDCGLYVQYPPREIDQNQIHDFAAPRHFQSSIAPQWRTFRPREETETTSLTLTLENYSDLPKQPCHSEKLPPL
jgi:hypothetical protein